MPLHHGVVTSDAKALSVAASVAMALDALSLPRVHYIGLSIGGMIGQAFALEHGRKLHFGDVVRHAAGKAATVFALGKSHADGVFDEGMWAPSTPRSVASVAQATRAATGGQATGPGVGEAQHAVRNN